jgi:hypothetical protein
LGFYDETCPPGFKVSISCDARIFRFILGFKDVVIVLNRQWYMMGLSIVGDWEKKSI